MIDFEKECIELRNENTETKKENKIIKRKLKKMSFLNIILIIILLVSNLGMYGYAMYVTKEHGRSAAYVAQWNVVVRSVQGEIAANGNSPTSPTKTIFADNATINMANTMVTNNHVKTGKVAPGNKGQIILEIDASSCETSVTYTLTMDPSNLPTNMNFYSDASYSVPFVLENGKITKRGNISLDNINTPVTEVIYWEWPFQTGQDAAEKLSNDVLDTTFNNQTLYADLAITVAQTNGFGSGENLASIAEVGDYVNYDATSGAGAGLSITPQASQTGSNTLTTFNSGDITRWRVFEKDENTGAVTLIAADPTSKTLTLSNFTGYINALDVLNSVGAIFGHGDGALNAATTGGGRSIGESDLSAHSSYNPANYKNGQHTDSGRNINAEQGITASGKGYYYYVEGTETANHIETQTYTSGTFLNENLEQVTASAGNPVTMKQTFYGYSGSIAQPYGNLIYKLSTNSSTNKPTYWVAARCVNLYPEYCDFAVRGVNSGRVSGSGLRASSGGVGSPAYAVVPMVTLESNIQVKGMDSNGYWVLDTDSN